MHDVTIKLGKAAVISVLLLFICYNLYSSNTLKQKLRSKLIDRGNVKSYIDMKKKAGSYNVWIIFTKVVEKSPLTYKFKNLIINILTVSSVPLTFHLFVDETSKAIATDYFQSLHDLQMQPILYKFYNVTQAASSIKDIVITMTPYFSSKPGTYYSDALFYLSLGLYKIAPKSQETAVMLDCDLYFKYDIALLFEQFKTFSNNHLLGLAPELTPVYRHVLHSYRMKHKTTFGEYFRPKDINKGSHPKGYQGYNSGVILFNLTAIRQSDEFSNLISTENVKNLTKKYKFKGHLGDQDFYTLVGYEHPHLIKPLSCGFNRQLCTWWRDNGYKKVFELYAKCDNETVILHGNCNTRIPTHD